MCEPGVASESSAFCAILHLQLPRTLAKAIIYSTHLQLHPLRFNEYHPWRFITSTICIISTRHLHLIWCIGWNVLMGTPLQRLHHWQKVIEANNIPVAEEESVLTLMHSKHRLHQLALNSNRNFLSGPQKKRHCCWSFFQGNALKGNSLNGHLSQTNSSGKMQQHLWQRLPSPTHNCVNEQVCIASMTHCNLSWLILIHTSL